MPSGAAKSSVGGPKFLGISPPPPDAHWSWMCVVDGPWDVNATFEVLRYYSGFIAIISGVGVLSEFTVGLVGDFVAWPCNICYIQQMLPYLHTSKNLLHCKDSRNMHTSQPSTFTSSSSSSICLPSESHQVISRHRHLPRSSESHHSSGA